MAETVPYHGARTNAPAPTPTDASTSEEAPGQAPSQVPSQATGFDATMPSVQGDGHLGDGAKVGRYDVKALVGAGGMGVVYRAYDPELHRVVALKLLKAGRATGPAAIKRRRRLLREARAMARLSHPNVIPVYDVGEYGDGLYVAMEFVEGSNAREWLKSVRPPWRRTLGVFRAAGRGLAAAHNAKLVHRDFKPANVMVGDDGRVRVLDFGLARAKVDEAETEEGTELPEIDFEGDWSETLTADGTILGTPVYMAPEQYTGKPADARSDQYSFCIALYEALFGRLPFAAKTLKDQARAKYRGEVLDPPSASPVPRRLFHVLCRGLSPHPQDRYHSMPDLLRELRTVHEDRIVTPPAWPGWAAVAGVVAVTAALVLMANLQDAPVVAPPACPEPSEALVGTWDEEQKEATRQAFVRSQVAGAEDRWGEVAARLDAYAAGLGEAYTRTCDDRGPPGSRANRLHDARLACLDRHRGELLAFVESLREPTAVVIHRAASAAHGLAPLEDCEDRSALLGDAEHDDPDRARSRELDAGIGRARALRTTGRPDAARRTIDRVIDQAGAEDLRQVTGRALLERAHLHRSTGDLAAAEHDLRAAYFNAVAGRRARLAATAAIGLVDVLAGRGQTEQALAWSEHARAHLDALEPARALDAALRQALAHVGAATTREDGAPAEAASGTTLKGAVTPARRPDK